MNYTCYLKLISKEFDILNIFHDLDESNKKEFSNVINFDIFRVNEFPLPMIDQLA